MISGIASCVLLTVLIQAAPHETLNVDGTIRRAVILTGASTPQPDGAPLVIVFHGRGGRAERVGARLKVHEYWPEAVVAYLQGLPGQRGANDAGGNRTGWQNSPGDQEDRDVKFFDVALEQIQKKYQTDPHRVYLLGHSIGSRFANVLWRTRGEKLAAICSAAAQGGQLIRGCKPISGFMIMGQRDEVVPFDGQRRSIALARAALDTDPSKFRMDGLARSETNRNGIELVVYIHPGGHAFPMDAMPSVVKFFQRHRRK